MDRERKFEFQEAGRTVRPRNPEVSPEMLCPNTEEATASKAMRAPIKPTPEMIENHNVSHIPFRDWRVYCVRGQAKSCGHFAQKGKENEQIPTISMDYGFFGSEGDGGADSGHPILICKDRISKKRASIPVPLKGTQHPYPVKAVVKFLNGLGHKIAILKSDQEPSIVALCKAIKTNWDGELIPEHSPKGVPKSSGEVEREVQTVQGLARTLKDHLEDRMGESLDPRSQILTWLVDYCSTLLNLFHIGSDGMSAYQRNKGKTWKVELPPFGEIVEFKRRTNSKLESRWETGVYLGVRDDTTEKVVGTKQGTFVVQSLRRKPEEDRVDKDLINNLRGVPWDPNPEAGVGLELHAPITLKPENPEVPRVPIEAYEKPVQPRRHYILRADLAKYGFSENCRACDEIRKGRVRTGGILHNPECRKRIEERMSADPEAVSDWIKHMGDSLKSLPAPWRTSRTPTSSTTSRPDPT